MDGARIEAGAGDEQPRRQPREEEAVGDDGPTVAHRDARYAVPRRTSSNPGLPSLDRSRTTVTSSSASASPDRTSTGPPRSDGPPPGGPPPRADRGCAARPKSAPSGRRRRAGRRRPACSSYPIPASGPRPRSDREDAVGASPLDRLACRATRPDAHDAFGALDGHDLDLRPASGPYGTGNVSPFRGRGGARPSRVVAPERGSRAIVSSDASAPRRGSASSRRCLAVTRACPRRAYAPSATTSRPSTSVATSADPNARPSGRWAGASTMGAR